MVEEDALGMARQSLALSSFLLFEWMEASPLLPRTHTQAREDGYWMERFGG